MQPGQWVTRREGGTVATRRPFLVTALAVIAVTAAIGGILILVKHAGTGQAATLCSAANGRYAMTRVGDGRYYVTLDEWGSTAQLCIRTGGDSDFTVTRSEIRQSTVGAYPDIAAAGKANGLPVQVSRMGNPTSSWATLTPATGKYNAAYDLSYSTSAASQSWEGGAEVMVWLTSHGHPHPAGTIVASGTRIGGQAYDVYVRPGSVTGKPVTVTFVRREPAASVTNLNLGEISRRAAGYGHFPASLYLYKVQAGFEIWRGGNGLSTTSFTYRPDTVAGLPG